MTFSGILRSVKKESGNSLKLSGESCFKDINLGSIYRLEVVYESYIKMASQIIQVKICAITLNTVPEYR